MKVSGENEPQREIHTRGCHHSPTAFELSNRHIVAAILALIMHRVTFQLILLTNDRQLNLNETFL